MITFANLTDADLSGCDLTGADIRHAEIQGAVFRGAILDKVKGFTREEAAALSISLTDRTKESIRIYLGIRRFYTVQ